MADLGECNRCDKPAFGHYIGEPVCKEHINAGPPSGEPLAFPVVLTVAVTATGVAVAALVIWMIVLTVTGQFPAHQGCTGV